MKTLLKTICDHAFVSLGGKLNIIGIFEEINAKQFPAVHHQMVLVLILNGDRNQKFSYYFDIKDSRGETIMDASKSPQTAVTGKNGNINIIINIANLKLGQEGKHTINFYADDFIESVDFNVIPVTRNVS